MDRVKQTTPSHQYALFLGCVLRLSHLAGKQVYGITLKQICFFCCLSHCHVLWPSGWYIYSILWSRVPTDGTTENDTFLGCHGPLRIESLDNLNARSSWHLLKPVFQLHKCIWGTEYLHWSTLMLLSWICPSTYHTDCKLGPEQTIYICKTMD